MNDNNNRIAATIDAISDATGRFAAWLTFLMVAVTFVIVVLRYALDMGFIWLQESLTWLHAAVFMLGAAYTLKEDEHVRVDIFYREMSATRRAWVNLLGTVFFIFPVAAFLGIESWDYVRAAWTIGEVSRDAGGLPFPAIPLLKSLLVLMPVAVGLQGVALLLRSYAVFRGH